MISLSAIRCRGLWSQCTRGFCELQRVEGAARALEGETRTAEDEGWTTTAQHRSRGQTNAIKGVPEVCTVSRARKPDLSRRHVTIGPRQELDLRAPWKYAVASAVARTWD